MMRVFAVLATVLLLSGCTWVRQEISPAFPPPAPIPAKPVETPRPPPRKPMTTLRPPAPPPVQSVTSKPVPIAPTDYNARCHAMADSRADDAKQLGASTADLAKVQQDVYRDCMTQSVKPSQ